MRWISGCQAAAQTLSAAASVVMVADRESDIYSLFTRKPERLDLMVCAGQNRGLAEGGYLSDALGKAAVLATIAVRVAPRAVRAIRDAWRSKSPYTQV